MYRHGILGRDALRIELTNLDAFVTFCALRVDELSDRLDGLDMHPLPKANVLQEMVTCREMGIILMKEVRMLKLELRMVEENLADHTTVVDK